MYGNRSWNHVVGSVQDTVLESVLTKAKQLPSLAPEQESAPCRTWTCQWLLSGMFWYFYGCLIHLGAVLKVVHQQMVYG